MVVAIVLTYVLPKGHFEQVTAPDGTVSTNYNNYIELPDASGINVAKGIFAPIMMFTADGWIQPLMLSLFLLTIAGVFQIMIDCGGMQAIVRRFVNKFQKRKLLFLALCILFFMILGSCFGLFEETLLLLPMVISVCTSLGYGLHVGFMVCTLATGIGFSVAITNPFTVVNASNLIGASVTKNIWFRFLIFAVYYALLVLFVFIATRTGKRKLPVSADGDEDAAVVSLADKTAADKQTDNIENGVQTDITDVPTMSDAQSDVTAESTQTVPDDRRKFIIYTVFLCVAFAAIITFTAVPVLRDLSMPLLIAVFLIGGVICGCLCCGFKNSAKWFGKGALSALPSVGMVLLAFGIKYILTEGQIIDTITHIIQSAIVGQPKFVTVLIIFGVILLLEFFVSSSTAKAVFVMGVLYGVLQSGALNVSPELVVLIYLFSDGFTNVLFPTSPVLLIGLSMTNQSYLGWLRRSKWLFPAVFLLAVGFLALGMAVGY
ncbi:MAG: SLC13 family permease [Corallococcus sp.]|nr:SLC13 family permease [Corallococcus sp.]MCM1358919.1 SLC13 family permease [Corallococcus sp.]MCM1394907.1 SLC13 family permease [Corallococcus sp.]